MAGMPLLRMTRVIFPRYCGHEVKSHWRVLAPQIPPDSDNPARVKAIPIVIDFNYSMADCNFTTEHSDTNVSNTQNSRHKHPVLREWERGGVIERSRSERRTWANITERIWLKWANFTINSGRSILTGCRDFGVPPALFNLRLQMSPFGRLKNVNNQYFE